MTKDSLSILILHVLYYVTKIAYQKKLIAYTLEASLLSTVASLGAGVIWCLLYSSLKVLNEP